jgi:TolA-binding protein
MRTETMPWRLRAGGLLLALLLPTLTPAAAQTAPNAPDPMQQRERIARVQAELARNAFARDRVERELRELQVQGDRLRIEQQRLRSEESRLQSELVQLQTAPR